MFESQSRYTQVVKTVGTSANGSRLRLKGLVKGHRALLNLQNESNSTILATPLPNVQHKMLVARTGPKKMTIQN